ncbi:MAG: hypothetical protein KJ601_03945 [Nanoarchaeota archaeon]|nr:hypothetical protein [Nanoarchaeota archaeon]MBU1704260.1 hypothetical protein [Nanoarchaeota archaeon]
MPAEIYSGRIGRSAWASHSVAYLLSFSSL